MRVLPILRYPDPRLHIVAKPVTVFDAVLKQLVDDMATTMYKAAGIGLAATQVNVHQRLLVLDLTEDQRDLQVFINPEFLWKSPETAVYEEGCLSVPEIYDGVSRHIAVKIRAQTIAGTYFEKNAEGLLAVCLQHEIDHLEGRVFVEYLSHLKQSRIQKRLRKQKIAGKNEAAQQIFREKI